MPPTSSRRPVRAHLPRVLTGAVLLLAAAGCGSTGSASSPAGSTLASARSDAPTSPAGTGAAGCTDGGEVTQATGPKASPSAIVRTSAGINDLGGAELLPTGFPVPAGVSVGQVAEISDTTITAELLVDDPNAAYRSLLTALPAAGYAITSCSTSPAVANVQFRGHECTGVDTQVVLSLSVSSLVCALH